MSDPLARFTNPAATKPARAPADVLAGPGQPPPYEAFHAKDKAHRLRMSRYLAASCNPRYSHLLDVVFDGPYGSSIRLVYTFMVVEIEGWNMQPIIEAIDAETCAEIIEWDYDRDGEPRDDGKTPIVKAIVTIREGERSSSAINAEKISGASEATGATNSRH